MMGDQEYVKVTNVDDLLDVIEAASGYTPDGVITGISVGGKWDSHIIGLQVETDDGVPGAVKALMEAELFGVVLWGERNHPLGSQVVAHVAFAKPEVPIIRATKTQWWFFGEVERFARQESQAKAALIYGGVNVEVADDKITMVSNRLLPEPRFGELPGEAFPPCPPSKGGEWMLGVLSKDEHLTRDECEWCIAALGTSIVTDDIMIEIAKLRLYEDGFRLETIRNRLAEVAAEAVDGKKGPALRAVAFTAFMLGHGELALAAVDIAEADNPRPEFTATLLNIYSGQVSPAELATFVVKSLEGKGGH